MTERGGRPCVFLCHPCACEDPGSLSFAVVLAPPGGAVPRSRPFHFRGEDCLSAAPVLPVLLVLSVAEGSVVEGSVVEGSEAEGSGAEGSGAEGSGAEGSGAEGSGAEGSGAEGSGAEGTLNQRPTTYKKQILHCVQNDNLRFFWGAPPGRHWFWVLLPKQKSLS